MDLHILICAVFLLFISPSYENVPREKRDTHVPSPGVPTFRRDSVESVPLIDESTDRKAAYMKLEEFGNERLPLRNAVESVPNLIASSDHLPLRDAVEKRPPPDQSVDDEVDIWNEFQYRKQFQEPAVKYGLRPYSNTLGTVQKESPLKSIAGYPYGKLGETQEPYVPYPGVQTDFQRQTLYSPLQYFRLLVGDYRKAEPYRVDNYNQQLLSHPFYPRGRSLRSKNPFLRDEPMNKTSGLFGDSSNAKKVVCYVQGKAVYRREPLSFTPEDINPFACTHIIYAFASLDPHSFNIMANDHEFDIVQGGYLSVTGLKRANPNLKVLLSVGGGREDGSHRFATMVSNASKRRDFIRSAIHFLKLYNFDGMDIHWQYPGAEELGGHTTDKEYLSLFMEELSELFRSRGWLLTIAAPASRFRVEDGFNIERLASLVDFVNVEAYNFHRDREPVADHHANLNRRPEDGDLDIFFNVDYAIRYWIKKGLPRSKLVMGIPFFGRSFTLQHFNETDIGSPIKGPGLEGYYTQKPGFLAYFEICDLIMNEGWEQHVDSSGAPYIVNGDQWVAFDDKESIKKKAAYVRDLDLGGAFIWSTDLDDFKGLCGEKFPLLSAVNKHLNGHDVEASTDPEMPVKPVGQCQGQGLYTDPNNCAAYYICRNSLSYYLSCADGMMFDPSTGACDFMSLEKCQPGQSIYIPNTFKRLGEEEYLRESEELETSKVVCYVTNWAFYRKSEGKFVPEHIDQRLCTHVVYAFASLDPEKLMIKEFDPWADLDNNLYERITALKDTKVLLSLGGWTDSSGDKYSRLVSDGSARRKFVIGAVSFLKKHGFRGLHFDWNYPVCWQSNCKKGPASDKPNFTKLVEELKKEFRKQSPRLILAAAISGYKEVIDVAYDLPGIGKELDFMSVMTYDYHGAWERQTGHVSPLYHHSGDRYPQYNTNFTMEYLISRGAPRQKLLLGVPFYGQTFTLAKSDKYNQGAPSTGTGEPGEFTKQPGMLAYYEICDRVKHKRWTVNRDPTGATGPYAYSRDQWVSYDDVQSIKDKAKYIKSNGFGGAVAWTIDLDDFSNSCCGGSFPLLRSLNKELGLIPDAYEHEDCTKPPTPVTPAPPVTTTGVDTGAEYTSEHMYHHPTTSSSLVTWWPTTPSTTSVPWWTPSSTTTKKPTTTVRQTTTTRRPTTQYTTTTTTTTTTTMKPSTSTVWWVPDTTTIPAATVVMPQHDKPMKSCELGLYEPDPNNCNAYYRCILGEMKKQYCAGGLHWNKDRGICDWPSEAKCEEKPTYTKPSSPRPVKKPTTTTTKKPYRPTTMRPQYVPAADDIMDSSCSNGQYYPHESCAMFYVCVNGQLLGQPCAPGLNWNHQTQICDWPFRVRCMDRKQMAQKYTHKQKTQNNKLYPEAYSTCEGNSFAAYSGDCGQYLHCLWGKYEIFQCAPGLHWNLDKQICDWPDSAKCTADNTVSNDLTPDQTINPIYQPSKPTEKPTQGSYPDWKPTYPIDRPSTTTEAPVYTEEPSNPQSGYFKIVCYFTNWAWYRRGVGKYVPEDIDPNLCTHIVYGFAVLDYENLVVKAHDSWADFDNKFYERVTAYKAKGIKVSLAIGGWNDSQGDKYSRLVNNPSARARFIKHVMEFLEKHNFDGLDLDWEYPKCWQVDCKKGPDSDKAAFAAWVRELKEAFRPKGYLLSAAVSPSKLVIDAGYDVKTVGYYLDWVAVMTYDFHGQWDKKTGHVAPLYYHPEDEVTYFNSNFSINYWISEGVPRRKIVMGMPLYGQSFQLERETNNGLYQNAPGPGQAGEFTRAAGFLAYYEICDNIKNKGWTVVKDPESRMGPYAYKGNQWVSFDDKEMIRQKSEYIRSMDLGGGMIWALDLDDFKNRCGEGRHPLLSTIRRVLADPGSGQVEPLKPETTPTKPPKPIHPTKPHEPSYGHEPTEPPKVDTEVTVSSVPQTTSVATPIVDGNSEFKVVCYFTNWAWYRQGHGKYLPSNIDPDLCTHIVYGFAVLNGDQLIIKPHDTWADFDNKFYEKVTALKAKGVKVLIAIGGWNDSAGDKYSKLVNNPSARRRFIAHVVDFIEANNFDGLDLDWEYPKCWQVDCNKGPETDKPAFAEFVRELHEAFQPKGLLLSSAVSPSKRVIDAGYDVPALSQYLDWIAVMCYDYHGQWDKITGHVAPMYTHPEDIDATFNTNFTIHYWIEKGADRKKLVMGMPMYGQSFSLAETTQNGLNAPTYGGGEAGEETRARGFLSYYEICSNVQNKGWTVVRDRKGRIGPYAHLRDQWVSFDDIGMIRHKSEYVKAMGLGGGMIWALDLDDFKNICGCEEYPLLRTINRVLRNYAKPAPKCILGGSQKKPAKTPLGETVTRKPDYITTPPSDLNNEEFLPCDGRLFVAHKTNCNQYYLCNQGELMLQACPNGLYWNRDHCDWPENTKCHPDSTTMSPVQTTENWIESTTQEVYVPPSIETTTSGGTGIDTPFIPPPSSSDGMKVVCYFTNWAWYRQGDGKYLPDDIDASLCTHITYGFAVLDPNTLTLKPHDSWADIDNDFYKKVIAYKAKGVKVSIALGGWNDSLGNKYSRLVNDPQARARFVAHIVQFMEKWGFDGLDLDWEYPKCWQVDCSKGPDSDKEGFASLVRELSAVMRPKGLLLSSAVSPSKAVIDAGYDVPTLSNYMDWIAVMTYDFHGHWDKQTGHVAPLYYYPGDTYDYFNANFTMNYWIEKGAHPKKLVMGMPLYGQSFSLADTSNKGLNAKSYGPGEAGEFTRAGGFLAFYEICERVRSRGWTVTRDPQGRIGPYAVMGNQWVSYDDISDIKRKSQLVKDLGLGGGMIWALDLDDFRNRCGCGKHPLLKTMNQELRGVSSDISMQNCT